MHLFGWAMMAAQAQEPQLLAIATGDVDCSGSVDVAELYLDSQGGLVVEIAHGVPERLLPEPISPVRGPNLTLQDTDGDQCDDLVLLDETDTPFLLKGTDHALTLARAARGSGDTAPDSYVALAKPPRRPTGTLRLGVHEFCDFELGCPPNHCDDACAEEAWTGLEACLTIGQVTYVCAVLECISIYQECA